jgi:hypothetical protein
MTYLQTKRISLIAAALVAAVSASATDPAVLEARLAPGDRGYGDQFGYSVSVSGNFAVSGSPLHDSAGFNHGAAYIYEMVGGAWTESVKLVAPDAAVFDNFGWSTAIDGNVLAVGSKGDDDVFGNSGSVYVYVFDGASWNFAQKISAPDKHSSQEFGSSVAVSGDMLVVGAHRSHGAAYAAGAAYVFRQSGGVWSAEAKLLASDGAAFDDFGYSVDTDGDSVIVGARLSDTVSSNDGSAYIFEDLGAGWVETALLSSGSGSNLENFGQAVSISGSSAAVGAPGRNASKGGVFVYSRSGGVWGLEDTFEDASTARLGSSVSMTGSLLAVGESNASLTATQMGAVHLYTASGSSWAYSERIEPDPAVAYGWMGWSAATDGTRVIAGALRQDVFKGAAYVFLAAQDAPDPLELLDELKDFTADAVNHKGIRNALTAKLNAAFAALEDEDEALAIEKLNDYINQVNALRGKKFTTSAADAMIAGAQEILALLDS